MKILIVDDNGNDRKILRLLLENKGCEVVEAVNGAEGLDAASNHMPDIIISDGLMPQVDGFQFLRNLKTRDSLKSIPFVFYSAMYTGDEEKDLALSLGADAFIFKPRGLEDLWQDLMPLLERSAAAKPASRVVPPLEQDDAYLRKYSHVVAIKLEEKVKELEQEIEERTAAEERIHTLSARLAEAEEQERRRIARELHDQVGQNLTALGINLNILRSQLDVPGAENALSRLDDSLALVEQTTERVRDVMADLRPPVLDDYGLAAAVQWYAKQFSNRTGIAIDTEIEGDVPRAGAGREIVLFRILQEALTNAAKHSKAKRVVVKMQAGGGLVRMTISDDGAGCDAAQGGAGKRAGWGLLNMKERARMIGGACRIESRPGGGTSVIVETPL